MSALPYGSASPKGWLAAGGGSVLIHGAVGLVLLLGTAPLLRPISTPDHGRNFTVTLDRLDTNTLVGFSLQNGQAGAPEATVIQGNSLVPNPTIEAAAPLDPVDETKPSVAPADPQESEAQVVETVTATPTDTLRAVVDPTVDIATTASLDPVTPVAPLSPVVEAIASPLAPTLSPVLPATSGPITPETVTVLSSANTTTPTTTQTLVVQPVAPVATAGLAAVSSAPPAAVAAPTPARVAAPAPVPNEQDLAIGTLLTRLRAADVPGCFVSLPRRDGTDGVGLELAAAREADFVSFANSVLTASDANLRQTRTLLDPRQCAALNYVQRNQDYPATRLALRLDAANIASGERLTGVLRGTAGKYVALLLVDNNGVVQDLQRFMASSGNLVRFDVPVTRDGPQRDTAQLLLAVAAQTPLTQILDRDGQLAENVFADLSGAAAGSAALAVTTFEVR